MVLSDLEWTHRITEAVSHAIPGLYGEGAGLASREPERIDRRYSFMFRYHVRLPNAGMRRVLVKIPRESWMRVINEAIKSENIQAWTKREFDTMTLIADIIEASNETGLFAIRPAAFLPEFGALLVEEHSLRMLKTSLARPSLVLGTQKALREFEERVELAGMWLRVVQRHSGVVQTKPLSALGVQNRLEEELSTLETISGRPLKVLLEQFQHLYRLLQGNAIPLAALHNDYHLGNVFVTDDGRVGVLDPNWVEEGAVYEDLSSLLIDPLTRKAQVLSLGILFRPFMYRRYEEAVRRGYFGDSNAPLPLIHFYCALDVLAKWRADEEVLIEEGPLARKFISRVVATIIRFYFQRLVVRYLQWGMASLDVVEK